MRINERPSPVVIFLRGWFLFACVLAIPYLGIFAALPAILELLHSGPFSTTWVSTLYSGVKMWIPTSLWLWVAFMLLNNTIYWAGMNFLNIANPNWHDLKRVRRKKSSRMPRPQFRMLVLP